MELDLDAYRAARAEARGEAPTIKLLGETFTMPVEVPAAVLQAFADDDKVAFGKALLGDEQWATFCEVGGTEDDLVVIASRLWTLYGVSLGESSGSNGSSETGGEPSSPTSNGSVRSTSDEPSGDATPLASAVSSS